MAIESRFIQLDRMAFEQSLMAFAATRPCAGALRWHAIGSVAIWTDDMKSVTHRAFLAEEILVIEYGAAWQEKKSLRKIVPQRTYRQDVRTGQMARINAVSFNEAVADCRPWRAPRRRMRAPATR